ncbi:MAG: PH domain-containing protein [Actinophytocola sp.]|uniref:PH domain-containing protein n=1 Tax=Actinophytocola sp. TaxID=1872138 RepID=UPI001323381F|nr:PH domain-containing protein [Actinophytocola sp.]MPZ86164.1 PH domain-containing protein [Actinophytocola sp.]
MSWQRLHRNTVVVTALTMAGVGLSVATPIVLGMLRGSRPAGPVLLIALGGVVALTGLSAFADRVRWRHTSYRITGERVELRYAWVLHKLRSIPRERVRTVDLTANPLLRAFGLTKVKIGTGQQVTGQQSHLTLDPIDRARAEELRRLLLDDEEPAPAAGEVVPAARPPIAELDWAWLRYAPVSVTTPILGAAAFGAVMQASDWFNLQGAVFTTVRDLFGGLSVLGLVAMLVAVGLVVGFVGSLGLFVEMWWRYRLTREKGTLRVHRGLLTTRSLSLERRRLRGVDMFEAFGARMLGAARVDVVATGLKATTENEKSNPKTLLPAAPIAIAQRVAVEVLGASPLSDVDIQAHPPAARARRLRWAVFGVAGVVAVLALLGALFTVVLLHLAWIAAVVLLPVAVALAVDDYRNLGHGLSGDYLVTRYGAGSRHTVALVRSGIIGWTVRSSPFQRRSGLVTIAATTAANSGEYFVRDVGENEGLRFAADTVPGLLTPFLEPRR